MAKPRILKTTLAPEDPDLERKLADWGRATGTPQDELAELLEFIRDGGEVVLEWGTSGVH